MKRTIDGLGYTILVIQKLDYILPWREMEKLSCGPDQIHDVDFDEKIFNLIMSSSEFSPPFLLISTNGVIVISGHFGLPLQNTCECLEMREAIC